MGHHRADQYMDNGSPGRKEEKKGSERIFKEIMAKTPQIC